MDLFQTRNRERNAESQRIYARYEIAHTVVDFAAAISFLAGSALYFWPDKETLSGSLFVIGSIFFMAKPTLRLARELRLWRIGEIDTLAGRQEG